jgi:hypothetical protein
VPVVPVDAVRFVPLESCPTYVTVIAPTTLLAIIVAEFAVIRLAIAAAAVAIVSDAPTCMV